MSEQISEELKKAFKVCADNNYAVVECDYINKLYDEIRDLRAMLDVLTSNIVLVRKTIQGKDTYSLEIKEGCETMDEYEYELFKGWLKKNDKQ